MNNPRPKIMTSLQRKTETLSLNSKPMLIEDNYAHDLKRKDLVALGTQGLECGDKDSLRKEQNYSPSKYLYMEDLNL